jgi:hypothetical protein
MLLASQRACTKFNSLVTFQEAKQQIVDLLVRAKQLHEQGVT